MFTPASYEKGSFAGPENSSPGRGNISNRLPVGISTLGDENQQIRIQLAVHKYNSSANNSINNRCNLVSPLRHSFLKNSLKGRNYDEDRETAGKIEKKCVNRYEGVGAFPTIHLKKNAVRYRPIRRFNEVKVPYPELPVNRFLSHLPELCPDLKSGTRSVLDVLQDLSKKKIHSKNEDDCNKPRSKGLGGDLVLGADIAYKPLFVQKPKVNAVLTRDNTTQTLLSHSLDTASSQSSDSSTSLPTQESSDPKAELRKKLARQNNEIFASLSSSITSAFPVKRKIDKVLPSKDNEYLNNGIALKKAKIYNHTNSTENKRGSILNTSNGNDHPVRINRKTKLNENNSTSPNKDRLTTIFLDMQNVTPKTQVFQNNSILSEIKTSSENSVLTLTSTGKMLENTVASGSVEHKSEENNLKKSPSINFIQPNTKTLSSYVEAEKKEETKIETNRENISFPVNKENAILSSKSDLSVQIKSPSSPSFTFGAYQATSENVSSVGKLVPSVTKTISHNLVSDKNNTNGFVKSTDATNKSFSFGTETENVVKTSFGDVKFGIEEDAKSTSSQPLISNKPLETEPTLKSNVSEVFASTTNSITINTLPQFTFGTKNSDAKTVPAISQTLMPFGTNTTSTNLSLSPSMKPSSTSGQSSLTSSILAHDSKENEKSLSKVSFSPAKVEITQNSLGESSLFGQSTSGGFIFGKKTEDVNGSKAVFDTGQNSGQNEALLSQSQPSQCTSQANSVLSKVITTQDASTHSTSFLQTCAKQSNETNSLFTFGLKPVVSEASTALITLPISTSAESKPQPLFSFTFGQNQTSQQSSENKTLETNVFSQKTTPGLFSFGQKTSQEPGMPSYTFGQTSNTQANSKPLVKSLQFGKSTNTTQPNSFGQSLSSIPETTNAFGSKSPIMSFGSSTAFGQNSSTFPTKTPLFGTPTTSARGFGASSSNAFGSSVSTPSTIEFGGSSTSQSTGFETPASTQSPVAFGVPSTMQSSATFVGSSTTQTSSGFGSSATTQPSTIFAFGNPVSSQPNTSFSNSASSQSITGFGPSPMSQAPFTQQFGQGNSKLTTSLGQTALFGQTTNNQNPVSSTGFASPSAQNFAGSSGQNNIFGQKTDSNIFGQPPEVQITPFGSNSTSQSFGTNNKYSFGSSTSNTTGFTTSAPNTTSASVFSFGANTPAQSSTYSFGGSSSSATNNFAFKFGASTTKEGSGFGASGSGATFSFGSNQMNNNAANDTKPTGSGFNFGNAPVAPVASSMPGFNFGSTPSPSVFSFGGSGSSISSGSSFNFGTPTPGASFGQSSTPSPAPFAVPGTFSIGSGSSQSRPRASSRLRRRP